MVRGDGMMVFLWYFNWMVDKEMCDDVLLMSERGRTHGGAMGKGWYSARQATRGSWT